MSRSNPSSALYSSQKRPEPPSFLRRLFSVDELFSLLKSLLLPHEMYESVEEIHLETLYQRGYRTILVDIDNTLMTYEEKRASLEKLNWIVYCKSLGFKVFAVSNNSDQRRIENVCKQLDIKGIYFACKPFSFATKELAQDHFIDLKKTIVVGDQVFKDVAMGHWLRCYTILVEPIDVRFSLLKRVQRDVELFLLRKLLIGDTVGLVLLIIRTHFF